MKITFADSFFDSLKTLARHQTWWYRTYYFFRRSVPRFFKNVYLFRKELFEHEWWDYSFTLRIMERSLRIMAKGMETKGMEVSETRKPKVEAMKRAIFLLESVRTSTYVDRAEKELGELKNMNNWLSDDFEESQEDRAHNRKVFARAQEIEDQEWKELWEIFKGTENSRKVGKDYDGTDMRSWWD